MIVKDSITAKYSRKICRRRPSQILAWYVKGFFCFSMLLVFILAPDDLPGQNQAAAKKLNVVFFLADDVGWKDLGCYGSSFYETPNLDALAKDGMRFTRAYAAAPVCSPTRASLLTGKYPLRMGITDYISGVWNTPAEAPKWKRNTPLLPAYNNDRLSHHEYTLAEAMKSAGYVTYYAGKWHLGPKDFWPQAQGFQTNAGGFTAGQPPSYFSPYKNPMLADGPEGEYLPERLAGETAAFIRANKEKPFFVYHSFYLAHTPLQAKEDMIRKYMEKAKSLNRTDSFGMEGTSKIRLNQSFAVYAAMIEAMDNAVGNIITALKEEGLYDQTLIVFTSDNGGLSTSERHPTSNVPLRAGKGWMYEGGIREPLLVRWPGVTKPGHVSDAVVMSPDFYPTVLSCTGQRPIAQQHIDGISFSGVLQGKQPVKRTLYWHYPHYGNQGGRPASCIMNGDWKLIRWYGDGEDTYELYNISNDLSEKENLVQKQPARVAAMKKKLELFLKEGHAKFPVINPEYQEKSNASLQ